MVKPARSVIVVISILVVLAMIVALLPFGVHYGLTREVRNAGVGELTIGETEFNPFQLTLALHNFSLSGEGHPYVAGDLLEVDLAWLALLQGKVAVESLTADGLEIWAREQDDGSWQVIPIPAGQDQEMPDSSEPLLYSLANVDASVNIRLEGEQISGELNLDSLSLDTLSNDPELADMTHLDLAGTWQGSPLSLKLESSLMAAEPVLSGQLTLTGIAVGDFQTLAGLRALSGSLDGELALTVNLNVSPLVSTELALQPAVKTSGSLTVTDLAASLEEGYALQVMKSGWSGEAAMDDVVAVSGDVTSDGTSVRKGDLILAEWQTLALTGLKVEMSEQISLGFEQMGTQGLALLQGSEGTLLEGDLTVSGVAVMMGESVSVQQISLSGFDAKVLIDESGEMLLTKQMATLSPPEEESDADPAQETRIDIGQVAVDGTILIRDLSQQPAFSQQVTVRELSVAELSSTVQTPSALVLDLGFDEYSSLKVNGDISPFADAAFFDGQLTAREVPLGPYTTYVEQAIGYEIETGQLDLDATIELASNELDVEIDALLRRFHVNAADRSDVDNELGMPLGAALNLVRDGDDNITLDNIGIQGDLSDPAISVRSLVIKAISKALLTGSMTYFKLALQPYGAALMAAEMIGKQAGKIRLDAVQMVPGESGVAQENLEYLTSLGKLMNERPGIYLKICGVASSVTDLPILLPPLQMPEGELEPSAEEAEPSAEAAETVLDEAAVSLLTALADARSAQVKSQLVTTGISSDRLLICKSTISDEETGHRVDLAVD